MTKTTTTTTDKATLEDRLHQHEAEQQAAVEAARERYGRIVAAEGAGREPDPEALALLGADLQVLEVTAVAMRQDIARVREYHAAVDELIRDPVAAAERHHAEAREAEAAAAAALVEAKAKLAETEKRAADAGSRQFEAAYAVSTARTRQQRLEARARDLRVALVKRGVPDSALPELPADEPPPLARARVLERIFTDGRIVEAGEVLEVPQDRVGGPLAPVGQALPPPAPVYDRNNLPPWCTAGWMQQQQREAEAAEADQS